MTFRTLEGAAGKGVTFESVAYQGYYLVSRDGKLLLAQNPSEEESTFLVSTDTTVNTETSTDDNENTVTKSSYEIQKTVRFYTEGETVATDDIRILMHLSNGKTQIVDTCTTDVEKLDTTQTGTQSLTVTWTYQNKTYKDTVDIRIVDSAYGTK
jgi:hypothetical protein